MGVSGSETCKTLITWHGGIYHKFLWYFCHWSLGNFCTATSQLFNGPVYLIEYVKPECDWVWNELPTHTHTHIHTHTGGKPSHTKEIPQQVWYKKKLFSQTKFNWESKEHFFAQIKFSTFGCCHKWISEWMSEFYCVPPLATETSYIIGMCVRFEFEVNFAG